MRLAIGSCDAPVTVIAHAVIISDIIFTVCVFPAAGQWIAFIIVGGTFIDVLAITVLRIEGIAIIADTIEAAFSVAAGGIVTAVVLRQLTFIDVCT